MAKTIKIKTPLSDKVMTTMYYTNQGRYVCVSVPKDVTGITVFRGLEKFYINIPLDVPVKIKKSHGKKK